MAAVSFVCPTRAPRAAYSISASVLCVSLTHIAAQVCAFMRTSQQGKCELASFLAALRRLDSCEPFRFCSRMAYEVEYNGVQVAGLKYRLPTVLDVLDALDSGWSVDLALEREPTNPFDPNAIRVVASPDRHIGYLPAVLSDSIAYRGLTSLRAELVDADIDDLMRVSIEIRVVAGE